MPTADHRRLRAAEAEVRHRLEHAEEIAVRERERVIEHFRKHWHLLPHADRHEMLELALLDATPAVIRMQSQIRLRDIAGERAAL
jgi:hypothetical protein